MSKLFTTILPSMLAGGLLFGTASTRADDGRSIVGFWPAASDVGAAGAAKAAGSGAHTPSHAADRTDASHAADARLAEAAEASDASDASDAARNPGQPRHQDP